MRLFDQNDREKWDRFVTVGVRLVMSHRWKAYRRHQRKFVRLVDALIRRYGEHPRLLATRADMMQRRSAKVPYLLKAYRRARLVRDKQEMVLTADSLAQTYLECRQLKSAAVWIKRLKTNLTNHRDKVCRAHCSKMETDLERVRTRRLMVRLRRARFSTLDAIRNGNHSNIC